MLACVVAFSAENRKPTFPENAPASGGDGARDWRVDFHYEGECGTEGVSVRTRLHPFGCQMAAERTRAWNAARFGQRLRSMLWNFVQLSSTKR